MDKIINLNDLSDEDLIKFIWETHRYETDENPHVYIKAIRSTLIALGYNEDFVNGKLYEMILNEWTDNL